MGGDGLNGGLHHPVARDAYGFNLNYFTGDYAAVSGKSIFPRHTAYMPGGSSRELYNGNISSMAVNIGKLNQPQLYNYGYDQLNRLTAMDAYRGFNTAGNNWSAIAVTTDYRERVSYDGNGNILTYARNGSAAAGYVNMDKLKYNYFRDGDGNLRNNRLRLVRDTVASGNYVSDIDDQLPAVQNGADSNYVYDGTGNLVQDKSEKIDNIEWTVYGKIKEIEKTSTATGTIKSISYEYDAAGNRVEKLVQRNGSNTGEYTSYVRDARACAPQRSEGVAM